MARLKFRKGGVLIDDHRDDDRAEKKKKKDYRAIKDVGFVAAVAGLFAEVVKLFVTFVFPGGESDMLRALGIRKGVLASFKYAIIMMTIPVRVVRWLINPDFVAYRAVEKAITPFLILIIAHKENGVTKTYQGFVEAIKSGGTVAMKANIESIDSFHLIFIARKLIVATVFVALLFFAGMFLWAFATLALQAYSGFELTHTVFSTYQYYGREAPGMFSVMGWSLLLLFADAIALVGVAYVFYVILKIIIWSVRSAYILDPGEMENFLIDLVDYTHAKTKEIYGEEVANQALFALRENFIMAKAVDMLHDDKMAAKLDLIEWKERGE